MVLVCTVCLLAFAIMSSDSALFLTESACQTRDAVVAVSSAHGHVKRDSGGARNNAQRQQKTRGLARRHVVERRSESHRFYDPITKNPTNFFSLPPCNSELSNTANTFFFRGKAQVTGEY
mmetsp:Transcript_4654/g.10448  ORF Transcript_4654/g.10448 Transcript_4654/m.10448 type:complete len:120 (+) Transcript_4654:110-469(+)